jgi:hypothetical protein
MGLTNWRISDPWGDVFREGLYMSFRVRLVAAGAVASLLAGAQARADDYTDLLDILFAKGGLTQSEYFELMAKHLRRAHVAAPPLRPARGGATLAE